MLCGHKIGLTSAPMQKLLGVDEPDFGYLLDSMVLPDGADGAGEPRSAHHASNPRWRFSCGHRCAVRR